MESFLTKYHPEKTEDLVIPKKNHLGNMLTFIARPYVGSWLLHGDDGLGKTASAQIMAKAAVDRPDHILTITEPTPKEMDRIGRIVNARPPLDGRMWAVILDGVDKLSEKDRYRLAHHMDGAGPVVWIFTASKMSKLNEHFTSRCHRQHFSAQGMAEPGAAHLKRIAALEGAALSQNQALKIMRECKNNMREAIQTLDVRIRGDVTPGKQPEQGSDPAVFRLS